MKNTAALACGLALIAAPTAQAQEQAPLTVDVESIHVPASTGKLASPGMRVTATCSENCLLVVKVTVPKSVARAIGIRKTVIGTGIDDAAAGELKSVWARVKRPIAKKLGRYSGKKRLKIDVKALP